VLPRTYLTVDTMTLRDRLDAATRFAGVGALLSGAAGLYASEVRGVRFPDLVLVLVPPDNRTRTTDWVQVRRTSRKPEPERWFGPARACVARSAADHALSLNRLDDVRALIATVVRHGHCSIAELNEQLQAGPRQGSALLRQALAEIAAGAASAPEARAAALLRRGGLDGFVQNARVNLPDGGYYVVDFLWPRLRAILEIDSREHHFQPADWRMTMDRHLVLSSLGYSVVHRPPSALRDARQFIREIGGWLAGRAAA
jgi:very-short-patch-repair endonuclease